MGGIAVLPPTAYTLRQFGEYTFQLVASSRCRSKLATSAVCTATANYTACGGSRPARLGDHEHQ